MISEVLFAPRPGDTAFVELFNPGSTPVDLTSMVLRVDTLDLPLPRLSAPLAAGARAVVRFDGAGTNEGRIIHAPGGFNLNSNAGTLILLRNDNRQLDRVAWGAAPGGVLPFDGGVGAPTFEPGTSIGRPAGTLEWVSYPPGSTTPGAANPPLPVRALLPVDGAILEEETPELAWYPVAGAARYHVQLGSDSAFVRPVLDQVVPEPTITAPRLPLGIYWWRVQAISGEGGPAAWSRPSQLELAAPSPGGGGFGGWIDPDLTSTNVPTLLAVPYLTQHKDTRMLVLESTQQTGPHAWDADHVVPSRIDPADTKNCAAANVAMINRFFGGDLSQDRIGYEVLSRYITRYVAAIQAGPLGFSLPLLASHVQERAPGPEQDLIFGMGLETLRVYAAFTYALGAPPDYVGSYQTKADIWTDITTEINAGRPLVFAGQIHMYTIRGYELRGNRRIVFVNDPARGRYSVDLNAGTLAPANVSMFKFPNRPRIARQEPEVTKDSDGDGVVDFDETQRFRTSPMNPDSDGDGVKDKPDIESGVFEREFGRGYAYNHAEIGRDYDGDHLPTEIDPDSDQGGCRDGDEDINGTGVRENQETSNFSDGDDICEKLDGSITYLIYALNPTSASNVKEIYDRATIQVRLKPDVTQSPRHYADDGSTFNYHGYARIEVDLTGCTIWGREAAGASGRFDQLTDRDVGGYRADDGTLTVGVLASVPAIASSGGCGQPAGSGPAERTVSLPECLGQYKQLSSGRRMYRFDCTTKPNMGPGWQVVDWYVRGWVRVR